VRTRIYLLGALSCLCMFASGCASKPPQTTFSGSLQNSFATNGAKSGTVLVFEPIAGHLGAYRSALCTIMPDTVFVTTAGRRPARTFTDAGVPDGQYPIAHAILSVSEHPVIVTGALVDGAYVCTEVSATAGAPALWSWATEKAPNAIPKPFPSGDSLEVSGTVVQPNANAGEAAAYFGIADSPVDDSSQPTAFGARSQFFLVDSSTTIVDGGTHSLYTPADASKLLPQPQGRKATAHLVVTQNAVYAREIVLH